MFRSKEWSSTMTWRYAPGFWFVTESCEKSGIRISNWAAEFNRACPYAELLDDAMLNPEEGVTPTNEVMDPGTQGTLVRRRRYSCRAVKL
jgi:hypothetical protein